jgi:hypothetical protein
VTWRKDEKELNLQEDSSKYHASPDGNLIIENVNQYIIEFNLSISINFKAQKADAGFYQCVAMNMVGERISKPARLSVYEKPKFLVNNYLIIKIVLY